MGSHDDSNEVTFAERAKLKLEPVQEGKKVVLRLNAVSGWVPSLKIKGKEGSSKPRQVNSNEGQYSVFSYAWHSIQ